MNLIYNLYLKLINTVLDNIRCYARDSGFLNKIEFIARDESFNLVTIYNKIIESDTIELVDLIPSNK